MSDNFTTGATNALTLEKFQEAMDKVKAINEKYKDTMIEAILVYNWANGAYKLHDRESDKRYLMVGPSQIYDVRKAAVLQQEYSLYLPGIPIIEDQEMVREILLKIITQVDDQLIKNIYFGEALEDHGDCKAG